MPDPKTPLPEWATQIIALYESNAASQFILHGNINDRILIPGSGETNGELGSLPGFFVRTLMPTFDVVLSYDLGNGLRVERGGDVFCQWPAIKDHPQLPKSPNAAIEHLSRYFRYSANLARLGRERITIGCIIKAAHLVAPATAGGVNNEVNSLALLMRDWSEDPMLAEHSLATCLLTENLNDLHPLLANNARSARLKIPLPGAREIEDAITLHAPKLTTALREFTTRPSFLAQQLTGATLTSIDSLLKIKEYRKESLVTAEVVALKKQLVEDECQGLIEFIQPKRSLKDLHGQDNLKNWLRQDIALWQQNDLKALPMGYLICGPVGTGKTYMVECLAGEAGVPVVKIRNFRDKWIGSTEGNLEKIFRLLQALNRCYVFIDEADQALGKRDTGQNDAGLSGRVYSMIATEMSRSENRGRIVWILASSRPDLIEVDLKRPGRVDVKIPIFPTSTPEEGWNLIRALARRQGIEFTDADFEAVAGLIPELLTPGAAEALSVKLYRLIRTAQTSTAGDAAAETGPDTSIAPPTPVAVLQKLLQSYRNPVSRETMGFQIQLAINEASDSAFIPAAFQAK